VIERAGKTILYVCWLQKNSFNGLFFQIILKTDCVGIFSVSNSNACGLLHPSSAFNASYGNNLHFLLLRFPLRAEIFNLQLLARGRKAFKAIIGSTEGKPLTEQTFAFFVEHSSLLSRPTASAVCD
jgi:hypothetical protein